MKMKLKKLGVPALVRLCVLMMALSLATMCLAFGTIARYATDNSHIETARVAKWGVAVTVTDSTGFENAYTKNGSVTVKSSTEDKVVAPGTSGEISISVSGTPEVNTVVTASLTPESDIHLGDYHPVKFTLKRGAEVVAEGTLQEVSTAINTLDSYEAGQSIDQDYTLAWIWEFEDGTDENDTALGNITAYTTQVTTADSTVVAYSLTITVAQTD